MVWGLGMKFDDMGTLNKIDARIKDLSDPDLRDLLHNIGAEVEAQTKRRIAVDKKAPDGSEWDEWSEGYVATKHGPKGSPHDAHPGQRRKAGKHTMLELTGHLRDSIQFQVDGSDAVIIGSNLKYANRMNEQRKFLGLSDENKEDIEDLVKNFFDVRGGFA